MELKIACSDTAVRKDKVVDTFLTDIAVGKVVSVLSAHDSAVDQMFAVGDIHNGSGGGFQAQMEITALLLFQIQQQHDAVFAVFT